MIIFGLSYKVLNYVLRGCESYLTSLESASKQVTKLNEMTVSYRASISHIPSYQIQDQSPSRLQVINE